MYSEMHADLLQELLTRQHDLPFNLTARDAGKCTLWITEHGLVEIVVLLH